MSSRNNGRLSHKETKTNVLPLFGKQTKTTRIKAVDNADVAVFCVIDRHGEECTCTNDVIDNINAMLESIGAGTIGWYTSLQGDCAYMQLLVFYVKGQHGYKDDIIKMIDIFIKHEPYIISDYIIDHIDGHNVIENTNPEKKTPFTKSNQPIADYLQFKIDYSHLFNF